MRDSILDKGRILAQRDMKVGSSSLSQVAFYGISIIIPLITEQMLNVHVWIRDCTLTFYSIHPFARTIYT